MASCATHLANFVYQELTHLGLYDTSSIDAGGVWLEPSSSGWSIMWHHPWPPEIITALVSDTNLEGDLTNFNPKLADLILHKATFLGACLKEIMDAPYSVLYNTPTISWITQVASTINPVIVDLLSIRALHSIFFSTPRSSTIWARRISWWMTQIAFWINWHNISC